MSNPLPQDPVVTIANRLLKRTRERQVQWRATDDGNAFLYTSKQSSVILGSSVDGDGDTNISMALLNERGIEVAELRSTWLPQSGHGDPSDPWDEISTRYKPGLYNKLLEELHEEARRNALKVDVVIEGLLAELGE